MMAHSELLYDKYLDEMLDKHRRWRDTNGCDGKQADLNNQKLWVLLDNRHMTRLLRPFTHGNNLIVKIDLSYRDLTGVLLSQEKIVDALNHGVKFNEAIMPDGKAFDVTNYKVTPRGTDHLASTTSNSSASAKREQI